jgi:LysM repeat protein
MSARFLLLGTSLLLVACATAQENPNYQHSTKYGQGQTQVAENGYSQPQAPETRQTQMPQSRSAATNANYLATPDVDTAPNGTGYLGNEGVTQRADQPAAQASSPTEQAYNSGQMQGTPGYEMMRAQSHAVQENNSGQLQTHPSYPAPRAPVYTETPAPAYTPYTPPAAPTPVAPRQVEYDYGDNLRADENTRAQPIAPRDNYAPNQTRTGTAANIGTGLSYIVREGDTVYSLARRLCAPMDEIMTTNAIGGDFAIAIGQTLLLPNSRC